MPAYCVAGTCMSVGVESQSGYCGAVSFSGILKISAETTAFRHKRALHIVGVETQCMPHFQALFKMPLQPTNPNLLASETDDIVISVRAFPTFKVLCRPAGFEVDVAPNDVASLTYIEKGGRLVATLHGGTILSLECSLEDAQSWSMGLLPEERDHEFMLETEEGERRCAWSPEEW